MIDSNDLAAIDTEYFVVEGGKRLLHCPSFKEHRSLLVSVRTELQRTTVLFDPSQT